MSRRITVWGVAALMAALALAGLAGCGDSDADSAAGSTAAPTAASPEGSWALTRLRTDGTMAALPSGVAVDATFAGGRVSGRAAVNSYSGPYAATAAGALTVGPLAATQMAGPATAMAVEAAYLRALEEARAFASDGRTLTLSSAAGTPLLEFAADARSLVGAWEVTGYNNGAQAVVSPVAGSAITAVFGDDGTLAGDAGVNTYRSDFTTTPGGSGPAAISISPPATTRKAGSQELMDQEQAFLAALESAATYTLRGDTAELRDGADAIAVTMTRR